MSEKMKSLSIRDFSKGVWRKIQNNKAPVGSYKNGINYDSDVEMGSLQSRLGTGIIGTQQQDNATCLGLHHFRDSVGSAHKLFAVYSNGSTNIVHDVLDGTSDLTGDTLNLKTRFLTYLDSCLRLNGTDGPKVFNGASWIITGGAFDLNNMPTGATGAIEWKDRVYLYGFTSDPDVLKYSGIADPATRTVSWTTGNGNMYFEREDGGGRITAVGKIPGYMIIFKRRSMKRWDGTSTYPEDLVNQGTHTQESICVSRGMLMFINENGIWVTNGEYPKKISRPVRDFVEAITDFDEVYAFADDDNAYFSIGTITVDGETWENCVLKLNIDDLSWNVRSYAHPFHFFARYIDASENQKIAFGDADGDVLQLNTGFADYLDGAATKEIHCHLELQDIDFGTRGFIKQIPQVQVFTENMQSGNIFFRTDKDEDNWGTPKALTSPAKNINDTVIKGRVVGIKITDSVKTGTSKVLGVDLLNVSTLENTIQ